jgi:hypothetical protein
MPITACPPLMFFPGVKDDVPDHRFHRRPFNE